MSEMLKDFKEDIRGITAIEFYIIIFVFSAIALIPFNSNIDVEYVESDTRRYIRESITELENVVIEDILNADIDPKYVYVNYIVYNKFGAEVKGMELATIDDKDILNSSNIDMDATFFHDREGNVYYIDNYVSILKEIIVKAKEMVNNDKNKRAFKRLHDR